ncbi:MAG: restriction endonuclease subunit S [Candidatus Sedimenticola sp. (ex Thyasira tokunagai)]
MSLSVEQEWVELPLGDLCDIGTGDKDVNEGDEFGEYPFFTCAQEISRSGSYSFEGDALLIAGNGNFNVKKHSGKFEAYQRTYVLQNFRIDHKYLYYFIFGNLRSITKDNRGSTIRYIRIGNLTDYLVQFPSINEQHRIVAKIEELFSELDKGIESLKTAREQLKVYRQALLKHAFEGKLTEQWRKENADKLETADQLLERINQEREARYQQQLEEWKAAVKQWEADGKEGKKPTKPRVFQVPEALTDDELAFLAELPQGVRWVKVGHLFDVYVGATPSRKEEKYWGGDIPWVSSGEVAFCTIKDTEEKITQGGYDNASTVAHPIGTVMLAMIGEGKTRGQAAILQLEAAHNQNTAAIRVSETSCSTSLFYYYLLYQYELTRLLGSGNNQKALNKDRVSNMTYPLFSIEEQEQISKVIDEKLSALESIESDISIGLSRSEALSQSILKKAFSGQLVPQDSNDEPASVLLDRIAKEKEEAAARVKKAKAAKKRPKTTRTSTRKAS